MKKILPDYHFILIANYSSKEAHERLSNQIGIGANFAYNGEFDTNTYKLTTFHWGQSNLKPMAWVKIEPNTTNNITYINVRTGLSDDINWILWGVLGLILLIAILSLFSPQNQPVFILVFLVFILGLAYGIIYYNYREGCHRIKKIMERIFEISAENIKVLQS